MKIKCENGRAMHHIAHWGLPRHSIGLLELQEEFIIQGIEVMEMKAQVFSCI